MYPDTGVVVHDHWKPYYTMEGLQHALCNAHHLRELKALVEIEKEDWARRMQILLRRACHAANLARERGVPIKPRLIELLERRYDAIFARGLAFHESLPPLSAAGAANKLCRKDYTCVAVNHGENEPIRHSSTVGIKGEN